MAKELPALMLSNVLGLSRTLLVISHDSLQPVSSQQHAMLFIPSANPVQGSTLCSGFVEKKSLLPQPSTQNLKHFRVF